MVTPDRALRLRGTGVGGVTIPNVGVAPRRWYRRCSTNGRCDEEERGKEEKESKNHKAKYGYGSVGGFISKADLEAMDDPFGRGG
ncbi:hypothetical protein Tco_1477883, partial [Tanacetum coccineum]